MNLRWKPIVPLAKAAVAVVVLTALSIRAVYPPAGVDIIAPPGISLVVPQLYRPIPRPTKCHPQHHQQDIYGQSENSSSWVHLSSIEQSTHLMCESLLGDSHESMRRRSTSVQQMTHT